jgi:hypothetical protein
MNIVPAILHQNLRSIGFPSQFIRKNYILRKLENFFSERIILVANLRLSVALEVRNLRTSSS